MSKRQRVIVNIIGFFVSGVAVLGAVWFYVNFIGGL